MHRVNGVLCVSSCSLFGFLLLVSWWVLCGEFVNPQSSSRLRDFELLNVEHPVLQVKKSASNEVAGLGKFGELRGPAGQPEPMCDVCLWGTGVNPKSIASLCVRWGVQCPWARRQLSPSAMYVFGGQV